MRAGMSFLMRSTFKLLFDANIVFISVIDAIPIYSLLS